MFTHNYASGVFLTASLQRSFSLPAIPSKKIQKSKDIASKGKSSVGTKIAQQARAHCNKLNDAERNALRNRGMQLIPQDQ